MASAGLSIRPASTGVVFTERSNLRTPAKHNNTIHASLEGNLKRKGSADSEGSWEAARPTLSVIEIESYLREKVKARYNDLLQAFQNYDIDSSSNVTRGEFRRVLESYCFPMTTDQFDAVVNKIKVNENGTVSYADFMDKFSPTDRKNNRPRRTIATRPGSGDMGQSTADGVKEMNTEMLEKSVREKIYNNLKNVLKGLRMYDYNRDGLIQRHELRKVLENYCFRMTDPQFDKFYQRYDFHHRGVLDYRDFLTRLGIRVDKNKQNANNNSVPAALSWQEYQQKLAGKTASPQKSDEEFIKGLNFDQIEIEFRKRMQNNYGNLKRMFLAFDPNLEGFIHIEDLKAVLGQFTFPLSDQLFSQLMDRFGIKASGKISWEFFLEKFQDAQSAGNGQTIPIKPAHKFFPVRGVDERMDLRDILRLLHQHVISHYSSFKQAFLQIDKAREGKISRKELKKIIQNFKIKISDEQFKELMIVLDPQQSNVISYPMFLRLFETRETKEGHKWLKSVHRFNDKPKPAILAWDTIEDLLCEKIQDQWTDFSTALMKKDGSMIGKIFPSELRKVVEYFTLPLSDQHFTSLVSRVTDQKDGKVNYVEFLLKLGITVKPGDLEGVSTQIFEGSHKAEEKRMNDQVMRQTVVDQRALDRTCDMLPQEIIARLKDSMFQHSPKFRDNFKAYDRTGKGSILKKDFRKMLEDQGFYLSNERFRELCIYLNFHNGRMSYSDFVQSFEDPRSSGPAISLVKSPNHYSYPIRGDENGMTAIEVESRLRNKLRENFESLRGAFYKFDDDHNGILTKANFRRMLDVFMCNLSDEEFEKLCQRIGVSKDSRLSYRDFLAKFETRDTVEGHKWLFSDHRFNDCPPMSGMSADDVHNSLAQKAHRNFKDLANAFRTLDGSGKGAVSKKQLRQLLDKLILPIDKEEFAKLWTRYDVGEKGFVSHDDFLQQLTGDIFAPGDQAGMSRKIVDESYANLENHHRTQQALHESITLNQANRSLTLSPDEVLQQFKDRIRDMYSDLYTAFKKYDSRQKGYLTPINIQKILVDFNYFLDDDQFYDLLEKIGMDSAKSRLNYEEFCHFLEEGRAENYKPPQEKVYYPDARYTKLQKEPLENKIKSIAEGQADVLQKAFQAFDRDQTGRIAPTNFRRLIDNFIFKLTDAQFKYIMNKLSVHNGQVNYNSFLGQYAGMENDQKTVDPELWMQDLERQLASGKESPLSQEEVENVVREAVGARFNGIARSFAEIDYAKIGVVAQNDFREVLHKHALRFTDEQFDKLWSSLRVNEFGNVDYHEFLRQFTSSWPTNANNNARPGTSSSDFLRLHTSSGRCSSQGRRGAMTAEMRAMTPLVNAENVERKLRDLVYGHWKDILKHCRSADPASSGRIHSHEFRSILSRYGTFSLPEDDLSRLLTKYDLSNDGFFAYQDFLRHLVLSTKTMDRAETPLLTRQKLQKARLTPTCENAGPYEEALMRVRQVVMVHWKQMKKDFGQIDPKGTGLVSNLDFRQVVKNYNINLSETEFDQLENNFSRDIAGNFDYMDFIKTFLKTA